MKIGMIFVFRRDNNDWHTSGTMYQLAKKKKKKKIVQVLTSIIKTNLVRSL
jgi:hypothetical protein